MKSFLFNIILIVAALLGFVEAAVSFVDGDSSAGREKLIMAWLIIIYMEIRK